AACATCVVRVWGVHGTPASPVSSPAPSSILPVGLEQTSDPHARLPNSPQGVFAQLVVADGAQLTEGPVQWRSERGLTGVTLAPGVHYDKRTQELVVPEAGVYYVFLHLTLKRVMAGNRNGSDSVSVALDLQPYQAGAALTLTLDLPPPPLGNSAAGFRSSLLHLDAGQRLSVHLRPRIREPLSWQLSAEATVWGLFRVATQVPSGLPLSKLT
ncbi:PREDICTED: tumor necrosis factor ligand superfamily member 9, partial [Bison bison bison]|uniref:Tumor necrosis factor ligand superfamily member 9 n=1 Tax=Bison bison bison TaxID=43346 RepID=A0A6P3GJV2_BISBB